MQRVREVMTTNPASVSGEATAREAARQMRDNDTGAMLVVDGNDLRGIVTDRDIVVRAVAESRDPDSTSVSDICTTGIQAIEPDASVDDALRMMREDDIRRLPVVKNGRPVGIISLGDLAVEREPDSTLADISAAAPDQ
jgi:CBS domain-containing protein